MTVKHYTAHSMQAAMALVKGDMGEDALIVKTRRIPRSSRDPYGRDMFEIEAVPSEEVPVPPLSETLKGDRSLDELARGIVRNVRKKNTHPGLKKTTKTDGWEELQADLDSIKEMLWCTGFNEALTELMQDTPEFFKVYSKLIKAGISENRVRLFMNRGIKTDNSGKGFDVTKQVLKEVIAPVETIDPFGEDADKGRLPKVSALIGPTGAGKTTTIAKLAAELGLKRKKKVGLVSVDSYRVGAVDQLKTYSAIIGIPCIPAFTGGDLVMAVKKLKGMDHILVDTAGQSPFDMGRMSELKGVMDHVSGMDKHLVISVTTSRLDMKEAVENFEMFNPSTYVFSKVDETKRCGNIIDQVMENRKPVSFITNGQEVPEDLMAATRRRVLELLITP